MKWMRFPKDGERVLVRVKDYVDGEPVWKAGLAIYNSKYGWPYKGITHWMPVPSVEIEEDE